MSTIPDCPLRNVAVAMTGRYYSEEDRRCTGIACGWFEVRGYPEYDDRRTDNKWGDVVNGCCGFARVTRGFDVPIPDGFVV